MKLREFRNLDLAEVHGQRRAVRALEVAAAGGHHLLLFGAPGAGKTMLALRIAAILPECEAQLRAPHHTLSIASLAGHAGPPPRPGELTLAHEGVLMLDEVDDLPHTHLVSVYNALRDRSVTLLTSDSRATLPADAQLVATINTGADRQHRWSLDRIARTILPVIDIAVRMVPVDVDNVPATGEPSEAVRARVARARSRQMDRWGCLNRDATEDSLRDDSVALRQAVETLDRITSAYGMAPNRSTRLLRVARTIADVDGEDWVNDMHVGEAISLFAEPLR